MRSTRRPFRMGVSLLGLALVVALAGCRGEERDASQAPEAQPVAAEGVAAEGQTADTKAVETPEDKAQLAKELAASRQQAVSKQEPIDPEVEKRMKDPAYRKQKDEMLNKLSQVSTAYFKQGIEIRHTRKRPEWRLIDTRLAAIADPAERRRKGEELAKKFKGEIEPVLEKPIDVIVFVDASESIQVY